MGRPVPVKAPGCEPFVDIYGPATRVDNIDDFEWEMKNEEVCYDQKSLFALKWPKLPMHASEKHKWIRKMCTTI